jgi:hypothetical protein
VARTPTDTRFLTGSVPARSAATRLRQSQRPTGAPIRGASIQSDGMRPSQSASVRSGVSAAKPSISSAPGVPSARLRPSQVRSLGEGEGAERLRIQRCGIGSSCDCSPRHKLTGTGHDLQRATAAGGTPLPATSRERMESAFSFDFAAVRMHTSAAADYAASALGARALTAGTDVLFRTGEYQPGTPGGDRLLAHELAHVVQQAHGLPRGTLDTGATGQLGKTAGLVADHASPAAEREAHRAAMGLAIGEPVPALSPQPPTIARQDDLDDLGTQPGTSIPDSPTDAGLLSEAGTVPQDAGTSPQYGLLTPFFGGPLEFTPWQRDDGTPVIEVSSPEFSAVGTVVVGANVDTSDYELGFTQTLISSSFVATYVDGAGGPYATDSIACSTLPVRDGFRGNAPWVYSSDVKELSAADGYVVKMSDQPINTIPWKTSDGQGSLAWASGNDELCTWLIVRQKSTGNLQFFGWVKWGIDWRSAFDSVAGAGKTTGTGGEVLDTGNGMGQINPILWDPVTRDACKLSWGGP